MTTESATRAALLTPLAPGAIAVIGLAGPETDAILTRVLRKTTGESMPRLPDRRPSFCRLLDGDTVVDDVVAVRVQRGNLTTAELNTHGGVRIVQRALQLLEHQGAEIIDGTAFYEKFHPRDHVTQAVDQALLISRSRRLTEWLLAQRVILPPFLARLHLLNEEERAAFKARSETATRLVEGLQIAMMGPPNAGKSTLANRLIGSDRAITSNLAGTTRDWISETALICGWPVTLTDTAGIREANCEIEAESIRRGRVQAHHADAILIVMDATMAAKAQREQLNDILTKLPEDRLKLVVHNKCDRANAAVASPSDAEPCKISALTGEGVDVLEKRMASLLELDSLDDIQPTAFLPNQLNRR